MAYMAQAKTDDWATPKHIFEKYDARYSFKLDVAASSINRLCENWFGLDHPDVTKRDGLTADWSGYGAIWCNPPYGRIIAKWVDKALEAENSVVMLLPSRTDTQWFHKLWNKAEDIEFVKGRLKFGDGCNPAPFPSIIVTL